MKSYLAKPGEVGGQWHVVDASGQVLGRLAVHLATVLMGKDKPTYTPHVVTGDFVIVVNAEKVQLTGRKMEQKTYDRYTYHPGGRKVESIASVMERHPERVLEKAVRRMLPKNKLGTEMFKRLKVYPGPTHPHQAQQPRPMTMTGRVLRTNRSSGND
jgi:large subunit ribosomal protein L13